MQPSPTVPENDLPRSSLIQDLPVEYHGPIDFPCFGCGLKSIAALHGVLLSKNSLMFQGAMRFSFPYIRGVGFSSWVPAWASHGYRLDIEYAAQMLGVEIETIDHGPERPWDDLWSEWKAYVAKGEPVYFCTRNGEILWDAAGYDEPPLYDGDDRRNVGHCVVLIGYDDDRDTAIIHDNYFFYGHTGGEDLPSYEVPVSVVEQAMAERRVGAPFVYKGRRAIRPDISEVLSVQAGIIRGTRYNAAFSPPVLPEAATGFAALEAAADDLEATNGDTEALRALLVGFDRFLRTAWWLGVDGQVARAAWLSGVSAATGNDDVESAASHLDQSATALSRARKHYVPLRDAVQSAAPQADVVRRELAGLARSFREAALAERSAAERIEAAVAALSPR